MDYLFCWQHESTSHNKDIICRSETRYGRGSWWFTREVGLGRIYGVDIGREVGLVTAPPVVSPENITARAVVLDLNQWARVHWMSFSLAWMRVCWWKATTHNVGQKEIRVDRLGGVYQERSVRMRPWGLLKRPSWNWDTSLKPHNETLAGSNRVRCEYLANRSSGMSLTQWPEVGWWNNMESFLRAWTVVWREAASLRLGQF
jgi:hypothetical protein